MPAVTVPGSVAVAVGVEDDVRDRLRCRELEVVDERRAVEVRLGERREPWRRGPTQAGSAGATQDAADAADPSSGEVVDELDERTGMLRDSERPGAAALGQ